MINPARCITPNANFVTKTLRTSDSRVILDHLSRTFATARKMSSPTPYLLHVTSHPAHVSPQTWKQWYKSEHLPDFVHSRTAVRAALYEEIDLTGASSPEAKQKQNFLAVYHTDFEKYLETPNYEGVRTTSTLFKEAGAKSDSIWENGDIDARYYERIQTYDPRNLGEGMYLHNIIYTRCRGPAAIHLLTQGSSRPRDDNCGSRTGEHR